MKHPLPKRDFLPLPPGRGTLAALLCGVLLMLQITLDKPGQFSRNEIEKPSQASEGKALVRVRQIGVCGTDLHAFAGRQPFFEYPRVLGHELGVEVLEISGNDRNIRPGDRCAVEPYLNCGHCIACSAGKPNCCEKLQVLGVHIDGGMRPIISVPVAKLHKSDKLNLDQLALVETLTIGNHAVERAKPLAGEQILVTGAGPIGLGAIQSLLAAGHQPIVADVVEHRLAFAQNTLGIERVINPAKGDLPEQLREAIGGNLPTLVIDATGHPASMHNAFNCAAHGGRIVLVGLFRGDISFHDPDLHKRELTLLASRNATPENFRQVIDLIETGRLDTAPWITHRMKLEDVPEKFPALPDQPNLIKAMIDVDPSV